MSNARTLGRQKPETVKPSDFDFNFKNSCDKALFALFTTVAVLILAALVFGVFILLGWAFSTFGVALLEGVRYILASLGDGVSWIYGFFHAVTYPAVGAVFGTDSRGASGLAKFSSVLFTGIVSLGLIPVVWYGIACILEFYDEKLGGKEESQ